jgi:tRNA pseudouridine55 synthase
MTVSLHGWLNIDKPAGLTSYQVISRLKRLTGQRHIGHAGTLDPLATGVLPIAFGQATRTIEFLHQVSKTYRAVIELGVETDTLDAEGKVIFRADVSQIDGQDIESALKPFIGKIEQVPPMYSALKRNGTPLYELARRGEIVEIKPRTVSIHRLDLIDFTSPLVTINVECGSGTYIRSMARDLGQNLGVGGHLKTLRRTHYGPFDINSSLGLDSLQSIADVESAFLPTDLALGHLPSLVLDEESAEKIEHGVVSPEFLSQLMEQKAYRLYRQDGQLLAVIDVSTEEHRLKVLNLTVAKSQVSDSQLGS